MPDISIRHIDTCLSCYLTDHHQRDGELLLGVAVTAATLNDEVRNELLCELDMAFDRLPDLPESWHEAAKAAIADEFATVNAFAQFDDNLDYADDDDDMGESCQAWFVLTWKTRLAMLEERQDVEEVTELSDDRFEVIDDVGSSMVGTFDEVTAWLDAGLDPADAKGGGAD